MFNENDKNLLKQKNVSEQDIQEQLNFFKSGFPFLELIAAASTEKGITKVKDESVYLKIWDDYSVSGKQIIKFVPASGAASRMFKSLFEFIDAPYNKPQNETELTFFDNIQKFAFYDELNAACISNYEKNITELISLGEYKNIVRSLLLSQGLNYGALPKGLLKFHRYSDEIRTPVEEHLTEGALYAKNSNNSVNIHFTVSPEHHALFETLIEEKKAHYENKLKIKYNVSFSEQKPKTDTIAVDLNNEPFRDKGELLFRPGGHGALIENLNDLNGDIIFIKNIDNVVPDAFKTTETRYKKLLAGVLVSVQQQAFEYMKLIDSGDYTHDQLLEVLHFVQNTLNIKNPETKLLEDVELVLYLKHKLNRPIRVCGMVKNVGEPGGGPFLTVNSDGTISPQILESSQIDMNDPAKVAMFNQGTHFNPVDLVCGVRNYKGDKFDLRKYVDKNTGFISFKSKSGRELKALELPGLWNGAMSDWNTIFVEVPIETFNPVKVVNDLLRKEHQGV
ncbi:DUF4301 family protein [Dysgonomonas sp. 216]|uniref:DUF4301 family protein n=1 Tax=Dysgonomonas sp. 216 TaxID=2302934 RepID=UPI00351A1DA2